ncbi:MAG TPA: tRNA epoxyqueuosine(34) reductase QueG [Polyangiaceae bacterium]|nr:tRNA epoxyqueuosine(34) reductase QueG [Polyangiaceae bacterium]
MSAAVALRERVRARAAALGFVRVGFTDATPLHDARGRLEAWLAAGRQGDLAYLATGDDRADPRALLATARTVVSVALPYAGRPVALRRSAGGPPLVGIVARYAVGADYHRVLKDKLELLRAGLAEELGSPVAARACVDSAPLLERAAAERAGVGFIGKSTMLIAPGLGTYFLLGELLLDVELPPDATPVASGCGRCTACLDACPTGAFVGPYELDASRCVSYLTIENPGPIPRPLRPLVGTRVLGCDVCQDVCPFNASSSPRPAAPELSPRPELDVPRLLDWLALGAASYRKLVRRSALRRLGKAQLQRNAAVALGNAGDPAAVPALVRTLEADPSPLVREHAAWALGRLGGEDARRALVAAVERDADAAVREEARLSLGG